MCITDHEWLRNKDHGSTGTECEWFSERVSIMVIDGGVDVGLARELSFKELESVRETMA